jgi:hypothetical protein
MPFVCAPESFEASGKTPECPIRSWHKPLGHASEPVAVNIRDSFSISTHGRNDHRKRFFVPQAPPAYTSGRCHGRAARVPLFLKSSLPWPSWLCSSLLRQVFSDVAASRPCGEMKDGPVHSFDFEGAVDHSLWDECDKAVGENVFFPIQP